MTSTPDLPLITTGALEHAGGDRRSIARASTRGSVHRVRRGVYVPAEAWRELDAVGRYRALCQSVSLVGRARPVLSHWSAAAVHGLPIVGEWPREVHRLIERTSGGRSTAETIAHPTRLDCADVVEMKGMLVTSVARTVVDLAATSSFASAVTTADFSLHRKRPARVMKADLYAAFEQARVTRFQRRIESVLQFSTSLADSPAESASRANLHLGGFEVPELQREYFDADGFIGATDFAWPGYRLVGEVDGRQKYLKPEYLKGRTPGEVVYEEKVREDRLRALSLGVVRWDWWRAIDPARLHPFLRAAGVPLRAARGR
ncbi:type IV toxin-antitoxin system AbiEi family antitoxin domain-containing protein [Subtercola boreus]|uniref:Transcriptional regulator, AbiEi antitoxin, Type IV TA system n=1 Tax=Subtercola boreus TaxID=120213 RepID=A0A3E0W8R4_9MICO|nr:type IV toxin-antitoxin system AbiEi family antitoxin domain-containing protein [Subtercola boreus]RFA18285.1 hypothetical protein B7R23_14665 [Subtercola boreus]RFA18677.1 hypothetical protein B7R24_14625 [Subtercola boreus]RFA25280.1 hypothetical protein B7R25_14660 [Subtercola boreus]